MLKIALINGITMGILNFYHFFYLFWTLFILFDPFLAFGYIWGQITIDCHMHIYKLCKNALINGISMAFLIFTIF